MPAKGGKTATRISSLPSSKSFITWSPLYWVRWPITYLLNKCPMIAPSIAIIMVNAMRIDLYCSSSISIPVFKVNTICFATSINQRTTPFQVCCFFGYLNQTSHLCRCLLFDVAKIHRYCEYKNKYITKFVCVILFNR